MKTPVYNPFREAIKELALNSAPHRNFLSVGLCLHYSGLRRDMTGTHYKASNYLLRVLYPHYGEVDWLIANCPDAAFWLKRAEGNPMIHDWRRRWLEHLADEYDKGKIIL